MAPQRPSARERRAAATTFRHVLVPTDLTSRTTKAFGLALQLATGKDADITLLHVIEVVRGLEFGELKRFYEKLARRAETKMAKLAKRAPMGVTVRTQVAYGPRAESIVKVAKARRADVIVLASHPVNPAMLGRDWGTISYKVGILAQCAVLLVK
jgi:universal stress protein A